MRVKWQFWRRGKEFDVVGGGSTRGMDVDLALPTLEALP